MNKIILMSLAAATIGCSEQTETGTVINGTIAGYANQQLIVNSSYGVDTLMTDANGSFSYSPQIDAPTYVRFNSSDKQKGLIALVDADEEATVTVGNADDWQRDFTVEGSEGTALLNELNKHYISSLDGLEKIRADYNTAMESVVPGSDEQKEITLAASDEYDSIIKSETAFIKSFIDNNISSPAAISALYQSFDYRTGKPLLLDDAEGLRYFDKVDSALMAKYPTAKDIIAFHENVAQIKTQMQQASAQPARQSSGLNIGDEAPDINLPTPDGGKLSLHSLRGKVVLLDFWASWCAPCRRENPSIVAAYNKYKSKGFDIFQVSLDKNGQAWKDAIAKDKLVWNNHVSDLQFWNSAAAKAYGVSSIPANFLLNKEGKIIAINLRGEDLASTLDMVLNQ